MYINIAEKIGKELAKHIIDGMFLPYNYKLTAKFFVDGCDTPAELAVVMSAVVLGLPLRQGICIG
ncbi:MAG: hypothetical protein NC223_01755 [Butyrivibrio sp.]|nr:hypothetical protein [Butyrivibrio sp.]